MDETRMINAIREYIADLGEPEPGWPAKEFNRVSYSSWAATEILAMVLAHADWTPMRAVEEFKTMVAPYGWRNTYNTDANEIFRTAYQVACDISDILYAMNY